MVRTIAPLGALLCMLGNVVAAPHSPSEPAPKCRLVPGDAEWPSDNDWNDFNQTVRGRLIRGVPLAEPCYSEGQNASQCVSVADAWSELDPRWEDPVNVMHPYWTNNTCSPFLVEQGSCELGNLASYAVEVTDAETVAASIRFAQENNLRLTIKNTGHDFLGRSTGRGALALWTHNLKDVDILKNYTSPGYIGPAVRVGAGVQGFEAVEATRKQGMRVASGDCPTVGLAGGWATGAGHGHLGPSYGLGADNILELEVVTVDGQHIVASPTENKDLYWAMSGGGSGNYAVVLSITFKAYKDGPVAGSSFTILNRDPDTFWPAVEAWVKHLLVLDHLPGLSTIGAFNNEYFALDFGTWPDKTAEEFIDALQPFFDELDRLGVELESSETKVHPTYQEHNEHFSTFPFVTNNTNGGYLVSRSVAEGKLPELMKVLRGITTEMNAGMGLIAGNYSHTRVGNEPGANAVLPAWRESLLSVNIVIPMAVDAGWEVMRAQQVKINEWTDQLRDLEPEGGAYMNEATYDNVYWKEDYYGDNYGRLLDVKHKYDPEHVLWASVAVGSDEVWALTPDRRLCAK